MFQATPKTTPPLVTDAFATRLGVKAQSVRVRLCRTGSYYGVRPQKSPNGRLLWPADGPDRVLSGESINGQVAA
ncbi:hypothetical protein Thivi_4617 [Thiocystis violascens DSM 198]|uniref:Uncharacterized protein n=1 Tax=Thiocystis violascens (strain ATCC 17096 / DSM 198 / 6111) TaxID=765911 RepID=I3YHE0_THIV6|nr:hypothetical protein Thivi_4617 [Thiocystis violascens DSM 198]